MADRRSHDSFELTPPDREYILKRLQDTESTLQARVDELRTDVEQLKVDYIQHLRPHLKRSSWPRTNEIMIRAFGVVAKGRAPWLLLVLLLLVAAGLVWRTR